VDTVCLRSEKLRGQEGGKKSYTDLNLDNKVKFVNLTCACFLRKTLPLVDLSHDISKHVKNKNNKNNKNGAVYSFERFHHPK